MASVTQTIPNLILGISQQADELIAPGFLKDAVNVLPDVADGLKKRPGGQLVGGTSYSAISRDYVGKWFAIDRDPTEQYIGRVHTNGRIEVWDALTGASIPVVYQTVPYKNPDAVINEFITSLSNVPVTGSPIDETCSIQAYTKAADEYYGLQKQYDDLKSKLTTLKSQLAKAIEDNKAIQVKELVYATTNKTASSKGGYFGGKKFLKEIKVGIFVFGNKTIQYGLSAVQKKYPGATISQGQLIQKAANYKGYFGNIYAYKVIPKPKLVDSLKQQVSNTESSISATLSDLNTAKIQYEKQASSCGVKINKPTKNTLPIISLEIDPDKTITKEGASSTDTYYEAVYTVSRTKTASKPFSSKLTVTLLIAGTATPNTDYQIRVDNTLIALNSGSTEFSFTFGKNQKSRKIRVRAVNDATVEAPETVLLSIKESGTYTASSLNQVSSGVISDDDVNSGVDSPVAAVSYFKHADSSKIKTFTINDYTFITNGDPAAPIGPVKMTTSSKSTLPYQGFVELRVIDKNSASYEMLVRRETTVSSKTKISTAVSLEIVGEPTYTDKDDATKNACENVGSETFTINPTGASANREGSKIVLANGTTYTYKGGAWKNAAGSTVTPEQGNLTFSLTTTAQVIPKDYSNAKKGYKCAYSADVEIIEGGDNWNVNDVVYVSMAKATYKIRVKQASTATYLGAVEQISIAPTTSSSDASSIITALQSAFAGLASSPFTTERIGNGIYIKSSIPFSIEAVDAHLVNVFTNRVNNITRLPISCKNGYTVQVINSAEEEDDYWLKFTCEEGKTAAGSVTSGEGVWEETHKPGIKKSFDASTMPHQLVRTTVFDSETNSSYKLFVVSPVDWEDREVGDDISVPIPSFVGKYISDICLYRNRLAFLADDTVCMSRAGDLFNFFAKTAITSIASDPIDIALGSSSAASATSMLASRSGLLLFSDREQFLLGTDGDILAPDNLKIDTISTYKFNNKTRPISLGTSIAFLGDTGANTSMYEITEIPQSSDARVVEQSKIVGSLLPDTLNQVTSSKDYGIIFIGESYYRDDVNSTSESIVDNEEASSIVWLFKYFDNGRERAQGAWFKWQLSGSLVSHAILNDGYYAVIRNNDELAETSVELTDVNFNSDYIELTTGEWALGFDIGATVNISVEDNNTLSGPYLVVDRDDDGTRLYVTEVDGSAVNFTETNNVSVTATTNPQDYISIQRFDLKQQNWSSVVTNSEGSSFNVHIDNAALITPDEITFDDNANESTFKVPSGLSTTKRVIAYSLDDASDLAGYAAEVTLDATTLDEDGYTATVPGDWSQASILVGYPVDMEVKLPKFYVKQKTESGYVADTRSSLIIHRVKVNFGDSGVFSSKLSRLGHEDYEEEYTVRTTDQYEIGTVPFKDSATQVIPVYARNVDTELTISSDHPGPATINSVVWEGDYNNRFYRGV